MKRLFGIDLTRSIAIILVIIVHCFLNMNFYDIKVSGIDTYLLLFIRNIAFTCVPLFLLLTGYCMTNKKLENDYFIKIKRIIIPYIIISIICIFFRVLYLNETFSLNHIIDIFRFKTIGYAWYIEMYIGLFLLIPFLNLIYNNLNSKNQKITLIIVLLILSAIPSTFTELHIESFNLNIFPSYWMIIYPLFYYYIGCFIKEYQPSHNKIIYFLFFIISLFIQTTIVFYMGYGEIIRNNVTNLYGSFFAIIPAVSIFLLIYNIKIHGNFIRKIVTIISKNSLNIYLFSFIFDKLFYKLIELKGILSVQICKSILIIVPLVFILSLISSIIVSRIIDIVTKIINFIKINHKSKSLNKDYY